MPFITTPERIGREEGVALGRLEGIQEMLEFRFGEQGLRLMPEIRQIHDVQRLEAILRAIKTAASPDDLRRMWAK